ncbi:MAG: YdeI/OmpD-associated family protein [Boseongicola sp.]
MAKPPTDTNTVEVRSRDELRDWLGKFHGNSTGIWLVHYKKSSPHYLPIGDIVAECLAHGWVDSLTRRKDDLRSMHWIAPRKQGSNWSVTNKKLVAELEASGLMTDAGRVAVESAKTDGSWARLEAVERLEVPKDLAVAFSVHPGSKAHWGAFTESVRRKNLVWILTAKRPETRAKRVRVIAESAEANEWVDQ